MADHGRAIRRDMWRLLPVFAFLVFSTALRAPISAVPPLLDRIGQDLGLSSVLLGVLTSIPVLCFGVLTPVASMWISRVGINAAGPHAAALIFAGALVRSSGLPWALFAGTVMIGAGITIGNLLAPMIIGRDFRRRAALLSGLYSSTINILVTIATALAVPLAELTSWQVSAAAWAVVPAVVGWGLWLWVFPRKEQSVRPSIAVRGGRPLGDPRAVRLGTPGMGTRILRWPFAWLMAIAFCGQTFSYYAFSGWLPTALAEIGDMTDSGAGVAASVFQLTGIIGPLSVPFMVEKLRWSRPRMLGVICGCWMVLPFGLVIAPFLWLPWSIVSGFAQGAFFTALFTIVIERTGSVDENRQLTALIQTVGYCAAALGPITVGWLHQNGATWNVSFLLIGAVTVAMTVCAQIASRDTSTPPPARGVRP